MTGLLKRLLKSRPEPVVTIVSGLPRSGTSMMMKMLEAGGIPPVVDEIREADSDNPKGYYEFERVKQMDKGDTAWLTEAPGKAVKVISALLKHLPADYQYQVIFMRRDMQEILASQRKMLDNRGEEASNMDDKKMAELFQKHLYSVEQWLQEQPNLSTLDVHYHQILADPVAQVERINTFLHAELDTEKMIEVVDPQLYRNRQFPSHPKGTTAD
jgi:argonaute-like protein implicated in RNA metabolism and viral defense